MYEDNHDVCKQKTRLDLLYFQNHLPINSVTILFEVYTNSQRDQMHQSIPYIFRMQYLFFVLLTNLSNLFDLIILSLLRQRLYMLGKI